ncbi:MAG TPA: NUDIX hydrolase [Propionibacteriaceae bacterium]|nr:NUDIX hydrolase [Propionibacteriaceae bacterium]
MEADGVGTLLWDAGVPPDVLEHALLITADESLLEQGVRRLQVAVPGRDHLLRRAVLRAGFRQEGVQRLAILDPDGIADDRYLFARLAIDQVGGSQGFSGVMNSALPRKRLIAHVLLRDDEDRVLLCETPFKPDWELPGGIVELGESPRLAAIREVNEELGVTWPVGRMLVADWMPPYLGWEDAIEMVFDGGRVTEAQLADFVLQASEIRRVKLCTLEEAAGLVTPIAHRRLTLAAGLRPDQMVYTEDGAPPEPVP